MADEIQVNLTIQVEKGELSFDVRETFTADLAGSGYAAGAPATSTTEAAIGMGDVASAGVCWFKNLEADGGNVIEIGVKPAATFYPLAKILPGECWPIRIADGVTLYMKAVAGTPRLAYVILPD